MEENIQTQFDTLYRDHRKALLRLARTRLRLRTPGLAEDVVDEVFMRLWDEMLDGNAPDDPVAWLESKVAQEARNERRSTTTRWDREVPAGSMEDIAELIEGKEEDEWFEHPDLTLEDIEFRTDFDAALRELPEADRQAFILTELRGLTVREAADVLSSDKTSIARQAEAARTYIRRELA